MGVVAGGELAGREPTADDVEPLTWALYERGRATSTLDHLAALDRLKGVARQIVARLDPYDALLTPALAQRPLPTGAVHGRGPDPMGNFRRSGVFTPFTAIFNVCGLPAISLPCSKAGRIADRRAARRTPGRRRAPAGTRSPTRGGPVVGRPPSTACRRLTGPTPDRGCAQLLKHAVPRAEPGFMDERREINCAMTTVLMDLVRAHGGHAAVDALLADSGCPHDARYLDQEENWIAADVADALLEAGRR